MDKIRSRGVTLVELVVAFAMLGLLSLIIFLTLQQSQRAQEVQAENADRKTKALLVRMHIMDLLRGARLLSPNSQTPQDTTLEFQKIQFSGERMLVDTFGLALWGGPETIRLDGGRLLHQVNGEDRLLGDLGALGSFEAFREPPFVRLEIVFQANAQDRREEVEVKVHLPTEVVLGVPGTAP